jgi:hypothetical protein
MSFGERGAATVRVAGWFVPAVLVIALAAFAA